MSKQTLIGPVLAFLSLVFVCASTGTGQSALFNVPTTDVVGERQLYLEADFDAHLFRLRNGGWHSFGVSAIYGTSDKTEIGLNAYFIRTADGVGPVEFQPNFKFQAYNNETNGVAVSAGTIAYVPLTKRALRDTIVSVYATASKKFRNEWAPRLTGGAYQLIGATREAGDKRGFLVGVEQPIHERVTLAADWNSGKNRFGYAAAGLGITLTKRSYLWTGYYFGNEGRANNSLGVYYGYSF